MQFCNLNSAHIELQKDGILEMCLYLSRNNFLFDALSEKYISKFSHLIRMFGSLILFNLILTQTHNTKNKKPIHFGWQNAIAASGLTVCWWKCVCQFSMLFFFNHQIATSIMNTKIEMFRLWSTNMEKI